MDVTVEKFIATVFEGIAPEEHVLLARQVDLEGGCQNAPWGETAASRWFRSKLPGSIYFNVSTVAEPEEQSPWRRRKEDCLAAYVLVLDDIGTKVSGQPSIEPSYKMETSAGNYQWGYLIQPYENLERYAQIVEALG